MAHEEIRARLMAADAGYDPRWLHVDVETLWKENEKLRRVFEAAEVLSTAMVESEANGANYDLVDEPWQHLTTAIQNCYS